MLMVESQSKKQLQAPFKAGIDQRWCWNVDKNMLFATSNLIVSSSKETADKNQ